MADDKNTRIANGVITGLLLICGIILSVLIHLLIQRTANENTSYTASTLWASGLAYIVPGLIGIIATLVGQKCGYVFQMVFSILTLVGMGIFFILCFILFAWLFLAFNIASTNCRDDAGSSSSCNDINTVNSMGNGILAMIVIGWIAALAASITGGMLACSREPSPTVVVHHNQHPAVTVMHMGDMQPNQPYVVQPGYGYYPQNQPNQYVAPPSYSHHEHSTGYEGLEHNYEALNRGKY